MTTLFVPLDRITPNPWQTRQAIDPDYIAELAADIAANGLLQNPLGRLQPDRANQYNISWPELIAHEPGLTVQLAFGHNRLEAFRKLAQGNPSFACMLVEIAPLSDVQLADYAWAENERRRDHTPLDRALAIQKRIADFSWSQQQVADHLRISRPVVSNSLALLKLPADLQAALGDSRLSERQAMALLALYDLPESIRMKAEADWGNRPSQIVESALKGASSDELRHNVQALTDRYSKDLGRASWKLGDDLPGEGVRSESCKECPARIKAKNLCTDPDCYRLKERLHAAAYLAKASAASGLPVLPADKDSNMVERLSGWDSERRLPEIRQSGCPNLCLTYSEYKYSNGAHSPEGFPNALIVCQKRAGYCACLNGLAQKAELERRQVASAPAAPTAQPAAPAEPVPTNGRSSTTAAELEELARAARAEKRALGQQMGVLVAAFGARLADGLRTGDVNAWRFLAHDVYWKLGLDKTKDLTLEQLLQALGEASAEKHKPYEPRNAHDVLNSFNHALTEAGLEPLEMPEFDKPAPKAQGAATWWRTASESKPNVPLTETLAAEAPAEAIRLSALCICGHTLDRHPGNPEDGYPCQECTCEMFDPDDVPDAEETEPLEF